MRIQKQMHCVTIRSFTYYLVYLTSQIEYCIANNTYFINGVRVQIRVICNILSLALFYNHHPICAGALRARIEEIENSFERKVDNSTVAAYIQNWFKTYCLPRLALNTANGYKVNIEKHIIPHIGDIRLNRLQPKDIQKMYAKLIESGLSGTSVRYIHNTLHKALVNAVKNQVLTKNAADFVEAPNVSNFEAIALTPAQAETLIAACKDTKIYIPVLLAIVLGLRRGEALGLEWSDIDFDYGTISIKRSAIYIKGQFILSGTKTKNSRRTLKLSLSMIECLKRHKTIQDTWALEFGKGFNPLNLVSCGRDGSPITPNALQHIFKDIVTANGLPNIRFHNLRHTNATMMLRSEVPAKIVSSMLGHSNIGITLDTYSHVMTDMQTVAVGVVEKILKL